MRDTVTTLLDTTGLALLSAGAGWGTFGLITGAIYDQPGWVAAARGAGLIVAGLVMLTGSWLADRTGRVEVTGDG